MRTRRSLSLTLGMLTLLTVILQLGPSYWPSGGFLLAALAVLPLALASALLPGRCTWIFLIAALALGLLSHHDLFLFLTTTAPMGLMLGLLEGRAPWLTVTATALVLTGGMLLMPALAGVFPWGGVETRWPESALVTADLSFAVGYAALWQAIFQEIWSRMRYNTDK